MTQGHAVQPYKEPEELLPALQGIWPELGQKQALALAMARLAIMHGLDPFTKELSLYQGDIYISHSAKLRKAYETEKLEWLETRPADEQEFKDRGWTREDTLHGWICEIKRKGMEKTFKGYGRVKVREYNYLLAKEKEKAQGQERPTFSWLLKEPADVAEKRAIDDCLRKAFPDSIVLRLPSPEQVIEGEYRVRDDQGDVASEVAEAETHEQSSLF